MERMPPSQAALDSGFFRRTAPLSYNDFSIPGSINSSRQSSTPSRSQCLALPEETSEDDVVSPDEFLDSLLLQTQTLEDAMMLNDLTSDLLNWLEEDESTTVNAGVSEEKISRNSRTRNSAVGETDDEGPEICVVCQIEFENSDKIETLRCGHRYHVGCIAKWLVKKNVCPICKATAF